MSWTTYVEAVRLDGHTWYYVRRVDDELSEDHPLPGGVSGAGALFPTDAQARTWARELSEPLSDKAPTIIDLDATRAWCADPTREVRDDGLLMSSWHALAELGATDSPPIVVEPREPGFALGAVADKVHLGYALTVSPDSKCEPPTWSAEDQTLLAQTLGPAVHRLAAAISARFA